MWSTDYTSDTDVAPEAVWRALRDWSTGAVAQASGDRHELRGNFTAGSTIISTLHGQDTMETHLIAVVEDTLLATETPFNGLRLTVHYSLQRSTDGGTRVTHSLAINGDNAADLGPKIGPRISDDFPETMNEIVDIARTKTA